MARTAQMPRGRGLEVSVLGNRVLNRLSLAEFHGEAPLSSIEQLQLIKTSLSCTTLIPTTPHIDSFNLRVDMSDRDHSASLDILGMPSCR